MMIKIRIARESRGLVLGFLFGRTLGFDYDGMPLNTSVSCSMGNDISYFGASLILYAKSSTGNIKSICLKDSHTNYSNNLGISM
jgi:hypothetical protein